MSKAIKVNATKPSTHRALRAFAANDRMDGSEFEVSRCARATYLPLFCAVDDTTDCHARLQQERAHAHRVARHLMVVAGTTFDYDLIEV